MPKDAAGGRTKPHKNAQAGPSKQRSRSLEEAGTQPATAVGKGKQKAGSWQGGAAKRKAGGSGGGAPGVGVSKIKASIRQTKRLLAREDLEPGLRLKTERRLHSLQQDLASSQSHAETLGAGTSESGAAKGKKAEKQSRVRFFERQKLMRLIRRCSKALILGKKGAADNLEKARLMLHYVHLFPANEKYISLFPHHTHSAGAIAYEDHTKLELPPHLDELLSSKKKKKSVGSGNAAEEELSARRREVLQCILELFRMGELPAEAEDMSPEDAVERYGQLMAPIIHSAQDDGEIASQAIPKPASKTKGDAKPTSKRSTSPLPTKGDLEGDEFFESD